MPRLAYLRACASGQLAQRRSMTHDNELVPAQPALLLHADRLRLAAAAYLARFKGTSRDHADSDLRCYLTWCADRCLDPFLARRPHLDLYIRWMPGSVQHGPIPGPGKPENLPAQPTGPAPPTAQNAECWTRIPLIQLKARRPQIGGYTRASTTDGSHAK